MTTTTDELSPTPTPEAAGGAAAPDELPVAADRHQSARPTADGRPVADDRPVADGASVVGRRGWRAAVRRRLVGGDVGMATAEYAIATVAAAGFAGLLIAILRSDEVRGLLLGIVRGALAV